MTLDPDGEAPHLAEECAEPVDPPRPHEDAWVPGLGDGAWPTTGIGDFAEDVDGDVAADPSAPGHERSIGQGWPPDFPDDWPPDFDDGFDGGWSIGTETP